MSNILVVEDTPTSRYWQKMLLERLGGWQVLIAENGVEAISVIEQAQVDVIVTDMLMPMMNGLELIQAVQSLFPSIPVIFAPETNQMVETEFAIEYGVASYVCTSDINDDLAATVELMLDLIDEDEVSVDVVKEMSQFELANDRASLVQGARSIRDIAWNMGLVSNHRRTQMAVALYYLLNDAVHFGHFELEPELRRKERVEFDGAAKIRRNREPYASRKLNIDVALDPISGMRIDIQHEGKPVFFPNSTYADRWGDEPSSDERTMVLLHALMGQIDYDPDHKRFTLKVPISSVAGS